ncbi:hypothetical protein HDU98_002000 [Podochytrium sp. JEL0797]|nr:hypothetical protein HDU98_002000 [Podochytrium sp. JEL0797]
MQIQTENTASTTASNSMASPLSPLGSLARTVSSAQVAEKFIAAPVSEEVMPRDSGVQLPKRVIAIACDDSPPSAHALQWTLDHLAAKGDQICILNVRPFAIPGYILGSSLAASAPGEFYPSSTYDFNEEYVEGLERFNREASHEILRKAGESVLARGIQCRAIALRGDPREEILAKLATLKPDMLVTGTRGDNLLKKMFRGSLSDYLVQHAACPVIVPKMQ